MELNILPEKDPGLQAALLMSLFEGILSRWLFGPVSDGSHIQEHNNVELAKEIGQVRVFWIIRNIKRRQTIMKKKYSYLTLILLLAIYFDFKCLWYER